VPFELEGAAFFEADLGFSEDSLVGFPLTSLSSATGGDWAVASSADMMITVQSQYGFEAWIEVDGGVPWYVGAAGGVDLLTSG
jgi:hypothetical protein